MKAEYPDNLDDFRLPMSREEYNAGVTDERPLSPLRLAYILNELERHMVELDEGQDAQDSVEAELQASVEAHEGRLKTVEEELDAIVQDAVTSAGFGLVKNGNELAIANLITGALAATGTVTSQNGHGQFTDFASFVAGHPNLRNGITRYNCIDTTSHIEIESPDSIAENRKQYLQDKAGKIAVEEGDGMIAVSSGYKVNGEQIIGARIGGWVEPTGTSDKTVAFDADNPDLVKLAIFVKALYLDLVAHGLIGD